MKFANVAISMVAAVIKLVEAEDPGGGVVGNRGVAGIVMSGCCVVERLGTVTGSGVDVSMGSPPPTKYELRFGCTDTAQLMLASAELMLFNTLLYAPPKTCWFIFAHILACKLKI